VAAEAEAEAIPAHARAQHGPQQQGQGSSASPITPPPPSSSSSSSSSSSAAFTTTTATATSFGAPMTREFLEQPPTYPRFSIVMAEPDVAVQSDPVRNAREVRRIRTGTIIFVTSRVVDGGSGMGWLRAPDGWIAESQQPAHEHTRLPATQRLYAVIPLADSSMSNTPVTASATATATPSSGSKQLPLQSVPSTPVTPMLASTTAKSSTATGDSVPESGAEIKPKVYSREESRKLFELYEKKYSSAESSMHNENDELFNLSNTKVCANKSNPAPAAATAGSSSSSSSSSASQLPGRGVASGIINSTAGGDNNETRQDEDEDEDEEEALQGGIEDKLSELRDLLRRHHHDDSPYVDLYRALQVAAIPSTEQILSVAKSTRLKRMLMMQEQMEHVTENLSSLSQSVLLTQQSLSALIHGKPCSTCVIYP